ncbi:hypothetical protein ACP70R_007835 [Stipagrostis hirtigluma subsp. patula]
MGIDKEAMVDAVGDATKPVVKKLSDLMELEWHKLSSLRDDVAFMKDELSSMHALLTKLGAGDGGDGDDDGAHLDVQVREWRDEVRRLSADIEACVGDFDRRIGDVNGSGGGGRQGGSAVAAFFRRNTRRVATVGARHSIGSRIKKLKARINDVSERRRRYNLDGMAHSFDM